MICAASETQELKTGDNLEQFENSFNLSSACQIGINYL
jgi:hypothetical protein